MKLDIPKKWKQLELGQLLQFVTGGDWGKDEAFVDEKYDFAYCIRGSEIKKWEEEKGRTASLRKIKKSSIESRKLKEGDILVEISGGGPEQPVGRTVLIDKAVLAFAPKIPKICTNFLRLIRPNDDVNSKYLNFYLKLHYTSGDIVNFQAGSNNLRNLKFPDYVKILVPLPPLTEQQAIVSKIEQLLSELDKGKHQLEAAQQQLKVYRQSLLKWAFEGKLTNKDVKEGELPKGWKWVQLNEVVEKISDGPFGSNLKSIDYVSEGVRVIRLENIGEMKFRDEYKTFVTTEKYQSLKNHTVRHGDIIFSSFIAETIRSVILPEYIDIAINKADCFLVRAADTIINKKYLAYFFSTKAMQYQLVNQIHGATRPRINTTQLKASIIPLPPLKEQHLIVQELESKLTVCDKIEETIAKSLQQAETLRQSILKRAFEGKLISVAAEQQTVYSNINILTNNSSVGAI